MADSSVKLAKVDATIAKKLAETHGIQGFPTIKYFKKGKASDYNGGRVDKEIIAWVNKKSGPAFHTVSTEEELTKLQDEHESIVLGAFPSLESASAKSFIAMATDSDDQVMLASFRKEQLNSEIISNCRLNCYYDNRFSSDLCCNFICGCVDQARTRRGHNCSPEELR